MRESIPRGVIHRQNIGLSSAFRRKAGSATKRVRDARIELAPQPWEGRVLPLNQSRKLKPTQNPLPPRTFGRRRRRDRRHDYNNLFTGLCNAERFAYRSFFPARGRKYCQIRLKHATARLKRFVAHLHLFRFSKRDRDLPRKTPDEVRKPRDYQKQESDPESVSPLFCLHYPLV